jgi:general secretion pathway protein D
VVGFDVEKVDYTMLLAVLRLNGYATTTRNGLVSVFPDALVRQQPMPTITADDPKMGDDELVTRVMQLRSACAAMTVPILRPMMPQYAHLAAYPDINMLIIVDRAANVRRIADIVERLEKQAATQKMSCLREGKSSS